MSFLPIYNTLTKNIPADILSVLGDRIYEDRAPMKRLPNGTGYEVTVKPPYIVWQALSGQARNHLDAPANFDDTQFQLMVYATTAKQAYELREAARKALENDCWILNPSINTYESDTNLYARGFDANYILPR